MLRLAVLVPVRVTVDGLADAVVGYDDSHVHDPGVHGVVLAVGVYAHVAVRLDAAVLDGDAAVAHLAAAGAV